MNQHTQPISILYTIPNFITAGSGKALLNIVKRLDRQQFEPSVCVLQKGGELEAAFEAIGVSVFEAPFTTTMKPTFSLLSRARVASEQFKGKRFDLWHSFHYLDDYSEPIIAKMSGVKKWVYTKKNMSWNNRSWYVRSLLADGIVAQNTAMKEHFFNGALLKRKMSMIPRGIDAKSFSLQEKSNSIRQQIGMNEKEVLIGCVAHLVPVKNQAVLIEAMGKVEGAKLVLIGKPMDSAYTQSLHDLIAERGVEDRVHFMGGTQEVAASLNQLDLFAFSSQMESCPVACLEAMACGLPSVVSDIPAMSDIHKNQETALFASVHDSNDFAEKINQLVGKQELRRAFGEASQKRVEDYYQIDREVKAHENFYQEILS